jgi:hypothetical protein
MDHFSYRKHQRGYQNRNGVCGEFPAILEGFFSAFFWEITEVFSTIDQTEKPESLGNILKGFGEVCS